MCPGIAPANNKTGGACPNLTSTHIGSDNINAWSSYPNTETSALYVKLVSGWVVGYTYLGTNFVFCK